jgi:hypothetical protein
MSTKGNETNEFLSLRSSSYLADHSKVPKGWACSGYPGGKNIDNLRARHYERYSRQFGELCKYVRIIVSAVLSVDLEFFKLGALLESQENRRFQRAISSPGTRSQVDAIPYPSCAKIQEVAVGRRRECFWKGSNLCVTGLETALVGVIICSGLTET